MVGLVLFKLVAGLRLVFELCFQLVDLRLTVGYHLGLFSQLSLHFFDFLLGGKDFFISLITLLEDNGAGTV